MGNFENYLEQIKQSNQLILVVVKNYEMGLISPCEMNKQISDLLKLIEVNKKLISKENGINRKAIELILLR